MVAVLQPVQQGKIIAIDRAVVLVGRSNDCDAIINGSQKISRRHCCLVQVDNSYYVRDLGSMNGVWLNGDRVNREAAMSSGDHLAIGDVEFLFHPNARIEQKKAVSADTAPVDAPLIPGRNGTDNTARQTADDASKEPVVYDVIDDVIPLDELDNDDELLVETNELEVIDQPILEVADDLVVDIDDEDPTLHFSDDSDNPDDIIVFDED